VWLLVAFCCVGIVGGICGVVVAAIDPVWFSNSFMGVPQDDSQMLRYAWVGGTIWGEELFGLVPMIVVLWIFRRNWRRNNFQSDQRPAPSVIIR